MLVIGLAKTGRAVASMLASEHAGVVVVDDGPRTPALEEAIAEVTALGCRVQIAPDTQEVHDLVARCDYVVTSPGVRPTHPVIRAATRLHKAVRSEIDLAAQRFRIPIVAVTGTNGKTTTVEMITAMLVAGGLKAASGGNIGTPLISFVAHDLDVIVAEVSSFQLEFVTGYWHPRVAVLLNVADDHLDWHGSFAAYKAAKARISQFQTSSDVLVINADDEAVAAIGATSNAQLTKVVLEGRDVHAFRVENDALCAPNGTLASVSELRRALPHDLTNSLCAAAATLAIRELMGRKPDIESVVSVLKNYETLPHRVQFIGENHGVRFVNDSKATNPHATLRAVAAFDSVVLVAGGLNKGLDLNVLRAASPRIRSVVAIGDASDEIVRAFEGVVPVQRSTGMSDAVRRAAAVAEPGDVVLLSPGCASFDMYAGGYTARGDDFAEAVHTMLNEERAS